MRPRIAAYQALKQSLSRGGTARYHVPHSILEFRKLELLGHLGRRHGCFASGQRSLSNTSPLVRTCHGTMQAHRGGAETGSTNLRVNPACSQTPITANPSSHGPGLSGAVLAAPRRCGLGRCCRSQR